MGTFNGKAYFKFIIRKMKANFFINYNFYYLKKYMVWFNFNY